MNPYKLSPNLFAANRINSKYIVSRRVSPRNRSLMTTLLLVLYTPSTIPPTTLFFFGQACCFWWELIDVKCKCSPGGWMDVGNSLDVSLATKVGFWCLHLGSSPESELSQGVSLYLYPALPRWHYSVLINLLWPGLNCDVSGPGLGYIWIYFSDWILFKVEETYLYISTKTNTITVNHKNLFQNSRLTNPLPLSFIKSVNRH